MMVSQSVSLRLTESCLGSSDCLRPNPALKFADWLLLVVVSLSVAITSHAIISHVIISHAITDTTLPSRFEDSR